MTWKRRSRMLPTKFGNALEIKEHEEAILPNLENLTMVDSTQDVFCPTVNAPLLSDSAKLDFAWKDAEGRLVTEEATLKHSVLCSSSSNTVTAATGVMNPGYGVVGMAGVGKTVALQGLAYDKDVRIRFPDGVFFMTLGQGAKEQTVLRELSKILIVTGASKLAAAVEKCTTLRDAVDCATPWFQNRSCLFLVDDVWPTMDSRTGFLTDLRLLLRDCPDSRMAISTRSTTIGQRAGSLVKFGARDPLGSASKRIFMSHATAGGSRGIYAELSSRPRSSVLKILSICAGLPITLAITGSAIAFLSSVRGDFEIACESYAAHLEKKRMFLRDEYTLEGLTLYAIISLGLESLVVEFLKWKAKRSLVIDYSIGDMYSSLCLLTNQPRISASILGQLWRLEEDAAMDVMDFFCGMSLATFDFRRSPNEYAEEAGITLHPLLLDFCRASFAHCSGSWSFYFTEKLKAISSASRGYDADRDAFSNERLLTKISNLSCSAAVSTQGHEKVIYATRNALHVFNLMHNENELGFTSDYESDSDLSCNSSSCGSLEFSKFKTRTCNFTTLSLAHNARRLVSGSRDGKVQLWNAETKELIGEAPTGHAEHVLSVANSNNCRLIERDSACVEISVVIAGSSEGTLHMWKFEGNEHTQTSVFECQHEIRSVCITENGQRAMSSAGDTISVWSTRKKKELRSLRGDSHEIFCLGVSDNGKYLASGSRDGTVRMWNLEEKRSWNSEEKKGQSIFKFSGPVSSVSISRDCLWLAATSMDGTTRIFNISTKAQTGAPIRHPAGDLPIVSLNDNGSRLIVSTGESISAWAVADNNADAYQVAEDITTLNITQ